MRSEEAETAIDLRGLTRFYGARRGIEDLTLAIGRGEIFGFLGPNGAGKTTTMRMILGLDAPTAGQVTIAGRPYRDLPAPLTEVGALIDAKALHGGRSAQNHLKVLALSNGLPVSRVDEVLRIVGLESVARRRAGGFSLGMGQRLGIAAALLGDPGILMFDEPVNGLDPEGILWVRNFMRALAAEGRTVLVSSHLMSEMALTADQLVVIGRGKLIADTSVEEFVNRSSVQSVVVRSRDDDRLARRLAELGATPTRLVGGGIDVTGVTSMTVGEAAAEAGIVLYELTPQRASLEEAFMEMTKDSVEYATSEGGTR